MNKELYIHNLLNEFVSNRITKENAILALIENGIEHPEEEINAHLLAITALKRAGILKQVQKIHNEFKVISPSNENQQVSIIKINKKDYFKIFLRIAAVFFISCSIGLGYLINKSNPKSMYNSIYEPYSLQTLRSDDMQPNLNTIANDFKNQNYLAVKNNFYKLKQPSKRETFLAAVSMQQIGEDTTAVNLFLNIISNRNIQPLDLYMDESEFYLALSYLKLNKIKEADILLTKISKDENHIFYSKVKTKIAYRFLSFRNAINIF